MLCIRINMIAKKFMDKKGGVSRFSLEFFCLTVLKNFAGQHFRVPLISGIENFYAQGGYVTKFSDNF